MLVDRSCCCWLKCLVISLFIRLDDNQNASMQLCHLVRNVTSQNCTDSRYRIWRDIITHWNELFYSAAALLEMQSAVLATAISSVCLSITRWHYTHTNEDRITRFLLRNSKNTLVFGHQQRLGGDVPINLKFALKVTHPLWKAPTSTNICL